MGKKPKVCIFCGATPLSKEHVWSEWTYQILPKVKGGTHVRGVIQTGKASPKIKGIRTLKTYQGQVNVIQIRAVCRSKTKGTNSLGKTGCNNGWMNHQDDGIKPILTPLILGQPAVLGPEQQRALASWIAMKVMVTEYSEPEDVVSTQEERSAMFNQRTVPAHWKIWIARQTGQLWRTGYLRQSATLGTPDETGTPIPPGGSRAKNTQLISIGFGYLVVHVFSTRVPEMRWDYPQGTLFRIHPFRDTLVWPPRNVMNGAQIDFLGRQYDRFLEGLHWVP
jgi:hypothetical protein